MLIVNYTPNVPVAGTYIFPITTEQGVSQNLKLYAQLHTVYNFGSGGTSIKAYLQTSLDDGVTWRDVICHTTGGVPSDKASAVSANVAALPAVEGTDGALADDTIVNGIVGRKWRVKIIIVGLYATTTFAVYVDFVDMRGS